MPVYRTVPGDMARLAEENGAGLSTELENPEVLAEAVQRLMDMPAVQRREMGHRGRTFIETHYSREKLAQRLAAIL